MVETIQRAIHQRKVIRFYYASLSSNRKFKEIKVHPYDIVNTNGYYYVVAYSLMHKQFRSYKISLERMKQVIELDELFVRDIDYQVKDYIGKKSIVKGEKVTVSLELRGDVAVYIAESEIGIDSSSHWDGDVLHFTTTFENEKSCDSFILSLGCDVRILSPTQVKRRIQDTIALMSEHMKC